MRHLPKCGHPPARELWDGAEPHGDWHTGSAEMPAAPMVLGMSPANATARLDLLIRGRTCFWTWAFYTAYYTIMV